MEGEILNKVERSGIDIIDLAEINHPGKRMCLDIKEWLFNNLVLKEKDFRSHVNEHNWQIYQNQNVAIHCSVDAIIPTWAYLLIGSKLEPIAYHFVFGNLEDLEKSIYQRIISEIDFSKYENKKVVIKGCGDTYIPETSYIELLRKLRPHVSSIMYGEPCSTVPIYKKPRQ